MTVGYHIQSNRNIELVMFRHGIIEWLRLINIQMDNEWMQSLLENIYTEM